MSNWPDQVVWSGRSDTVAQIVLLGISGFLGTALARHLAQNGHQVFGFVRQESDLYIRLNINNIKLLQYSSFLELLKNNKIDSIVNCMVLYDKDSYSTQEIEYANVQFPLELLKIAASIMQTGRFFNIETVLPDSTNRYTRSKAALREKLKAFLPQFELAHLVLDYVYGPFDHPQKLIPSVMRGCLDQVPELAFTEGLQKRRFLQIDDCVRAIRLCLESPQSSPEVRYDIGGQDSVTLRSFIEQIHQACQPTQTQLRWGQLPYRDNEVFETQLSLEAIQVLGWRQEMGIKAGIQKMVLIEKEQRLCQMQSN